MTPDTGEERYGIDVSDVIASVKKAIVEAKIYGPAATDVVVTGISLNLSVVVNMSAGGDATFQVPFINKELGVQAKREWSTTNKVQIDLEPPPKVGATQGLGQHDWTSELAQAISLIRATVQAAQASQPVFGLKEGDVTLAFGVSTDGSIKLVASGDRNKDTTHELVLKLGPAPPPSPPPAPPPAVPG